MKTISHDSDYAHRRELQAVEYGHRAFVQDDGSIKVVSHSRPGHSHRVTYSATTMPDVPIVFACTCEAGTYRREAVPCWHSALAGRRLEREGLAIWRAGLWYSSEGQRLVSPDGEVFDSLDVFEEIERAQNAEMGLPRDQHWGMQQ